MFPVVLSMILQIFVGAFSLGFSPGNLVVTVVVVFVLVVYTISALVLIEWSLGSYVPGANDNATGTAAVLALMEEWKRSPVESVELVALLTGSEETGLIGSAAWAKANQKKTRSLQTVFLNFDNLGRGRIRFLGKEYSIGTLPFRYPKALIELCEKSSDEVELVDAGPKTFPLASDGLSFLAHGIPGATIMCFEDNGLVPHGHQMTDTVENVDFDIAWSAVEFGRDVLVRAASWAKAEAARS
jgi:Zn-dependent M28 family amino/carboxypeptidase